MVTVDLSNAGFWLQFGIYAAAFLAGILYYFKKKKAGEVAPPQLMKMFTDQTTMALQWFWKAVADGVITPEEAEELKNKLQLNFETTITSIIKLYTIKLPIDLVPDVILDPVVPEIEPIDEEIASEEPPLSPLIIASGSGGNPPLAE